MKETLKCRDCKWLSFEDSGIGRKCLNPSNVWRTETAMWKQPWVKACKHFEAKEVTETSAEELIPGDEVELGGVTWVVLYVGKNVVRGFSRETIFRVEGETIKKIKKTGRRCEQINEIQEFMKRLDRYKVTVESSATKYVEAYSYEEAKEIALANTKSLGKGRKITDIEIVQKGIKTDETANAENKDE